MTRVAICRILMGETDEGIKLIENVREKCESKDWTVDPKFVGIMWGLAIGYFNANRLNDSVPLLEQLLKVHSKVFGEDHFQTFSVGGDLGKNYAHVDRNKEALPLLESAYKQGGRCLLFGPALVDVYVELGMIDLAEQLVESHIDSIRNKLPAGSPRLAQQLRAVLEFPKKS